MVSLAFDTFAAITRLKAADFTEVQAKEIVATLRETDMHGLATRDDFHRLESEIGRLDAKIDKVELKLSGEIGQLKWMIGLVVAGILALLLKNYFPG